MLQKFKQKIIYVRVYIHTYTHIIHTHTHAHTHTMPTRKDSQEYLLLVCTEVKKQNKTMSIRDLYLRDQNYTKEGSDSHKSQSSFWLGPLGEGESVE